MSIITNRKSVRKFTTDDVNIDQLSLLVEAGQAAPSSKNKQPWQFVLLTDEALIQEVAAHHPNWTILKNANKAIIVCGDLSKDERETHMVIACSAATQNILLKCTELELGAVWLGLYPDLGRVNYLQGKLNLPQHIVPISLVAIGYPQDNQPKKRDLDLAIMHTNGWTGE